MPGNGALYSHKTPVIMNRADFERYPWSSVPRRFVSTYYRDYGLLREYMPPVLKAIGGSGNGVFERVQDLVGYENLCDMMFRGTQGQA